MNIGDKILKLRKSNGYSQEDIANKLNVSRQTVSKWETNQSTPDFDKIVPLCDLFGISTDELLKDVSAPKEKVVEKEEVIENNDFNEYVRIGKRKFAFHLSISILLYFISIMWIIFASETLNMNDGIMVSIFLGIIGVATVLIVYSSMVNLSKAKEVEESKKHENKKAKDINNILALVVLLIYLVVSFATGAWAITWLLWIVYAILEEIVKAIFELGDKDE